MKVIVRFLVLTITVSSKTRTASIKTEDSKSIPAEPVKTLDEGPSLDQKLDLAKNMRSKWKSIPQVTSQFGDSSFLLNNAKLKDLMTGYEKDRNKLRAFLAIHENQSL